MAIRKYKNGDKVPVFLHVLDICAHLYKQISLKIAIIDHYQELKGHLESQQLNQSLMIIIASTVKSFDTVLFDVANAYSIELKECLGTDQRIIRISSELYWSLVLDEFPSSIEEEDADTLDYIEMHNLYSLSLLSVLKGVFQMFCYGELDFGKFYDLNDCCADFWLSKNCDQQHLQAVVKLLQLNNQLLVYQNELYKHVLNFNLKQCEEKYL